MPFIRQSRSVWHLISRRIYCAEKQSATRPPKSTSGERLFVEELRDHRIGIADCRFQGTDRLLAIGNTRLALHLLCRARGLMDRSCANAGGRPLERVRRLAPAAIIRRRFQALDAAV